jgi:hypothetical protein
MDALQSLRLHLDARAMHSARLTLDAKGDSTSGKFTIDQWDESGNLLAHVQGNITGTRVTMETGFQSVK